MNSNHPSNLTQITKPEASKPGVLRDDFYEDIMHRSHLANQGIAQDNSLRVTPIFDKKTKRGKLITSGRKELQDLVDKILSSKRKVNHEKATITTYPDDKGFEPEEFKKIALPQLARTLKSLRERLGLPSGALENVTLSIEQDIQKKLNGWFNQSGDSTEASEGDKATQ